MTIAQGRRLAIILDPDVDAALSVIVAQTNQPVATAIRQMLREALPELQAAADAIRMAKRSREKAASSFVAAVDQKIRETQQELLPLRAVRGRKPKG